MLLFIFEKVTIPIAQVCQVIQEFLVNHEGPATNTTIHLTPFWMVANKVDLQILFRVYKQANFPQKGNLAVKLGAFKYNQFSLPKAQCTCIWCPAIVLIYRYIKCLNHPQATTQNVKPGPEVVAYKRFQILWVDLETFGFWKTGRWGEIVTYTLGGCNRRFDCVINFVDIYTGSYWSSFGGQMQRLCQ